MAVRGLPPRGFYVTPAGLALLTRRTRCVERTGEGDEFLSIGKWRVEGRFELARYWPRTLRSSFGEICGRVRLLT